jgi:nucleoside-diphosphate-sugar epimerase
MRVLIVGAAGNVGRILQPALESHHECFYFDRVAVPGRENRTIVADVNDDAAVRRAVATVDAVVYLAMGITPRHFTQDIPTAFDVNVQAVYRFLKRMLAAGGRRFVFASSLSVYESHTLRTYPLDESVPTDAFNPYGATKAAAEAICVQAANHYRDATIVALRLMFPMGELAWSKWRRWYVPRGMHPQGPEDMRSLFLAALDCPRPGAHVVQTTGDIAGEHFSNEKAMLALGWRPKGG